VRFFPNAAKEKNFHAQYKSMIEEKYPNGLSDKLWDVIAQDDEDHDLSVILMLTELESHWQCGLANVG